MHIYSTTVCEIQLNLSVLGTGTISDVQSFLVCVVFSSGYLCKSDFSHVNTLYTLNPLSIKWQFERHFLQLR